MAILGLGLEGRVSSGLSVWRLAGRFVDSPNPWMVVVTPSTPEELAEELSEEVNAYAEGSSQERSIWLVACEAAEVLLALKEHPGEVVVASVDALSESEWKRLDRARATLRGGPDDSNQLIFVLSQDKVDLAATAAPHLWSFFASALYHFLPRQPLSSDARETRLQVLRDQYKMTDEVLVERATRGEVSLDPAIAEWLILLGHSDLLE